MFFVFKKGKKPHANNVQLGRYGRNRTNVWQYPGASAFGRNGDEGDLLAVHPTPKPVALIADVLLDASVRGDLVLDPFMGSGSTLIAAHKVGRRARGIELDPLYVDAAIRRFERWTGEPARLEADGRAFREVEAERSEGSAMTANAGSGGPDGPRDRLASCLAAAWSFQILRRRPFSETGITSFSAPVIVAPTVLALRRWPFGFGQYPGLKRPVRRRADQGRMVSALYAGSAASELRASVSELGHCRQSQGHK